MAEKFGLQREGETTFMDEYLPRIRELPGSSRFRTGVSLLESFVEQSYLPNPGSLESLKSGSSHLPKPGSSEDRFILFVSLPYFGRSTEKIPPDPNNESVGLLDFKRLGVDAPSRRALAKGEEERDDIGKILVHQARYMVFDNCKLYFSAYS